MAQFVKNYVQDLAQDIQIRHCGTLIFNTDSDSNVINVALYNGQEEAPQTGSVVCCVICSDGSTVPVTGGTISGNVVSVTLGADGLIPGQAGVGIQVVTGSVKTTVFKAIYNVALFETDNVVDPSSRITISVGELVSDIEASVASIPADYSDLLAAIAPAYADLTFPVKKGTFCWNSGTLYTAKQDIDTSESWTASHWISSPLANELAERVDDLKSAFDYATDRNAVSMVGGVYFVGFVNGYYSKIEATALPYHVKVTSSGSYCSVDPTMPIIIHRGDTLTIDSAYTVTTVYKMVKDNGGSYAMSQFSTTVLNEINTDHQYTFAEDGFYLITVRKSVNGSYVSFDSSELTGKVYVTTSAYNKPAFDSIDYTDKRLVAATQGQFYYAEFIQGTISRVSTGSSYLINSASGNYCSTDLTRPLIVNQGDVIDVDSSYTIAVCNKIIIDDVGFKLVTQNSDAIGASHYKFKEAGLYVLCIRKPNGSGGYLDFNPLELEGKISITSRGLANVYSPDPQKPLNPYANLYWGGTQYITSCHAHCLNTIAGLIDAGYTALIPTNYRPPKPYYPLKAFYPDVQGIENYLAAPNTEVAGKIGTGINAHLSTLGSLFACGTDSSANYTGSIDDLVNDCRNTRKGWFIGGLIINHPQYSGLSAADMLPAIEKYSDILGIEIYNYGCEQINGTGYSITQWDAILSAGFQCFGFAAPDHGLETGATPNTPYGFIHVIPACPTDDALLAAIGGGRFYCSLYNDGLKFTEIKQESGKISVTASATEESSPSVKFITATRESTVNGFTGEFTYQTSDVYVRVEVTNGNNKLYSNAIFV